MARFFLGQQVRLKFANDERAVPLIGTETRIVGEFHGIFDVYWELGLAHPEGGLWRVPKDQASNCLEPVQPSGHRASTESFQELIDRLNTEKVARVEEAAA